jgi:hypothetical protein
MGLIVEPCLEFKMLSQRGMYVCDIGRQVNHMDQMALISIPVILDKGIFTEVVPAQIITLVILKLLDKAGA